MVGEQLEALARAKGLRVQAVAARCRLTPASVALCYQDAGTFETAQRVAGAHGKKIKIAVARRKKVHTAAWLSEQTGLSLPTCARALMFLGSFSGGVGISILPGQGTYTGSAIGPTLEVMHLDTIIKVVIAMGGRIELVGSY